MNAGELSHACDFLRDGLRGSSPRQKREFIHHVKVQASWVVQLFWYPSVLGWCRFYIQIHVLLILKVRETLSPLSCTRCLNRWYRRCNLFKMFVKAKTSLCRPREASWGSGNLRLPEFLDSRHIKVVRILVIRTDRIYPQEVSFFLNSVRGWDGLRTIMWPEGLCNWKIPKILLGEM